jgi:hypothetical protein
MILDQKDFKEVNLKLIAIELTPPTLVWSMLLLEMSTTQLKYIEFMLLRLMHKNQILCNILEKTKLCLK